MWAVPEAGIVARGLSGLQQGRAPVCCQTQLLLGRVSNAAPPALPPATEFLEDSLMHAVVRHPQWGSMAQQA